MRYVESIDKFEIKFIKFNKTKQVTRVNMRFELEDEE